jgi:fructan beta-fructosidase
MQYFIGDFDGTTFTNDNPADVTLWSDYGRDNYAAVSWSDVPASDGRRLWIGWMNHWMYARRVPTDNWQGAMTLPRRLQLARRPAGVRLIQTPIAELTRLRGPATRQGEVMITPTLPLRVPGTGEVFEVELEVRAATAMECGVRVRHGAEHHTTIAYDVAAATLVVDRAHAGQTAFNPAFAATQEAPLTPRPETLALHIFVDRSSVEVFADAGDVVITSLIFPDARTTDLEVYAVGGEAQVGTLTVYPLGAVGTSGMVGATDGVVVVTLPPAGDRVGREG